MKQDTRPPCNSAESRLDALAHLLQEESVPEQKEQAETSNKHEKVIIISVNGNNNVISAEKAKQISGHYGRKTVLFAGAILCMLFF